MLYAAYMKYKYVISILLLLVCLESAGCRGCFPDALCKDDHGVIQHGNTEFAWFLVNSFNYLWEHLFEVIALFVASFFVYGWGISLIQSDNSTKKFLGWVLLVTASAFLAYLYVMVMLIMVLLVAFAINGFRR